ncbi:NAD(P)/FAD-dependent oxidoreductase [Agarilytica rhodophyticola]|uniref:NAD(P)/FAD-dependent oxidoreductase n=1 Tax=Agarilytica rhodophyticola TaxID=1737490 RepID=UPI0013159689|nr:FAD/NAD(P)-binding oxidoreductase [Agarilytica rhodophyticola]
MSNNAYVRRVKEEVVIVGGGSAGLNAAIQLARRGVSSAIVDENPKLGGVVYRGAPRQSNINYQHLEKTTHDKIYQFQALYKQYQDYINLYNQTQVLGPLQKHNELGLLTRNGFCELNYKRLIVATGCYERAVQFPGWTLPGVITIGCAQLQVKSGLLKPGKSIVLVGTGPLLPIAAKQLHLSGVRVLGVYEAGHFSTLAKEAYKLMHNPKLLLQGLHCMAFLKMAKIPFHYGWGIVEAKGDDKVNDVTVAPYDEQWNADLSRAKTISVDSLATGYGFIPRTELTQLLGLEHRNNPFTGYQTAVDENYRTSVSNIYAAGDSTGFYGSQVAAESGKLAAISCLVDMGKMLTSEAAELSSTIKGKIKRYKTFQSSFHKFSSIKEGILQLPNSDTTICRCENVNKMAVDKALADGVKDCTSLKMKTRIGMGDCQGKMCSAFCYDYLKKNLQKKPTEIGRLKPRFPLVPLPFSATIEQEETHD